jgi:hypothetical protein
MDDPPATTAGSDEVEHEGVFEAVVDDDAVVHTMLVPCAFDANVIEPIRGLVPPAMQPLIDIARISPTKPRQRREQSVSLSLTDALELILNSNPALR